MTTFLNSHLTLLSKSLSRTGIVLSLGIFGLTACSKPETKSVAMPKNASPAEVTAAAEKANNDNVTNNERLGTRWGDEVTSKVTSIDLPRLSDTPFTELQVHYANKAFGGKSLNDISLGAGEISFNVTSDGGKPLPIYRAGMGGDTSYYLVAQDGQAYQLHYHNNTGKTYEIVASVDGLDVLNGQAASRGNTGYILEPHKDLNIEGFRKSDTAVASFIFSKPKDAYANHNTSGSINNTGIIGTVVYELKAPLTKPKKSAYAPPPTPTPNAFPADK